MKRKQPKDKEILPKEQYKDRKKHMDLKFSVFLSVQLSYYVRTIVKATACIILSNDIPKETNSCCLIIFKRDQNRQINCIYGSFYHEIKLSHYEKSISFPASKQLLPMFVMTSEDWGYCSQPHCLTCVYLLILSRAASGMTNSKISKIPKMISFNKNAIRTL